VAGPSPKRRGSSTPTRALAIIFSALVHMAVVSGFLWQLRWRPIEETGGVLQVELLRQLGERPPAKEKHTPRSRGQAPISRSSPSQTAPRATTSAASPTPPEAEIVPPAPVAPQGLSQALRHSLGCAQADYYGMTASEREECRLRAVRLARAGRDGTYYGLAPAKQAAFDAEVKRENLLQEPFLAERPKEGCKPTVTEHETAVYGVRTPPNWTASVACTIRF
jgi:hypothetical protein